MCEISCIGRSRIRDYSDQVRLGKRVYKTSTRYFARPVQRMPVNINKNQLNSVIDKKVFFVINVTFLCEKDHLLTANVHSVRNVYSFVSKLALETSFLA